MIKIGRLFLIGLAILISMLALRVSAQAPSGASVKIVGQNGAYRLERNGVLYFIKGAGGDGSKKLLRDLGDNSFRTWEADNAGPLLDEAHKLGMTVTVGIWLGHKEHGFDYSNSEQVAAQYEQARKTILKYRDHPALLMWALGNEMEGGGNNAAIWSAVNNMAAMVKKLDPNHPTMTVVAEIGGSKVKNINRLCPEIDVLGINSYGGGPSLARKYKAAGGIKPYVITEYGPPGVWEVGKNSFGAVDEMTSTAKAEAYSNTYRNSIVNNGLCVGSYAFAWGNKQETTATWFGLMLPDGSRLGATDILSQLWTGKMPAHTCPVLSSLKTVADQVEPGATIKAVLSASSPNHDPLKVTWLLQRDVQNVNTNGATEAAPPVYAEAIVHANSRSAQVKLPTQGGVYRLFAYIHDEHGGAAVANVPILVKGRASIGATAIAHSK